MLKLLLPSYFSVGAPTTGAVTLDIDAGSSLNQQYTQAQYTYDSDTAGDFEGICCAASGVNLFAFGHSNSLLWSPLTYKSNTVVHFRSLGTLSNAITVMVEQVSAQNCMCNISVRRNSLARAPAVVPRKSPATITSAWLGLIMTDSRATN